MPRNYNIKQVHFVGQIDSSMIPDCCGSCSNHRQKIYYQPGGFGQRQYLCSVLNIGTPDFGYCEKFLRSSQYRILRSGTGRYNKV